MCDIDPKFRTFLVRALALGYYSFAFDSSNYERKRTKINFGDFITTEHVQSLCMKNLSICLKNYKKEEKMEQEEDLSDLSDNGQNITFEPSKYNVVATLPQTAELKAKKGSATWIEISSESDED